MKKAVVSGAVLGAAALLASGCGTGQGGGAGENGKTTLNVYAASSLKETFGVLEKEFESANQNVDVKFNFGGSSTLVQQINEGAPADVFASANEKNMDKLVQADGAQGKPTLFASNTLQIAVPKGNPKQIKTFKDLAKPDVTLVVCASEVPCGSATEEVEKATKVTLKPKSEEPNVKSVVSKVQANEADAGLVYVTDVKAAADQVDGVTFPEAQQAVNEYPIVATKNSQHADLAKKWVEFVLGEQGRAELEKAGFDVP